MGDQIRESRKAQNLNQMDLALKCKLDIRTIQRIESGEVMPRLYTLRIINEALGTNFVKKTTNEDTSLEVARLQRIFETRRKIRIPMIRQSPQGEKRELDYCCQYPCYSSS